MRNVALMFYNRAFVLGGRRCIVYKGAQVRYYNPRWFVRGFPWSKRPIISTDLFPITNEAVKSISITWYVGSERVGPGARCQHCSDGMGGGTGWLVVGHGLGTGWLLWSLLLRQP